MENLEDSKIIDKATRIRPGEEIDVRSIIPFLRDAIQDLSCDVEITQFPSGFSNLTYEIRSGDRRMVPRRPPHRCQGG